MVSGMPSCSSTSDCGSVSIWGSGTCTNPSTATGCVERLVFGTGLQVTSGINGYPTGVVNLKFLAEGSDKV
jgi:hypothetical protein